MVGLIKGILKKYSITWGALKKCIACIDIFLRCSKLIEVVFIRGKSKFEAGGSS